MVSVARGLLFFSSDSETEVFIKELDVNDEISQSSACNIARDVQVILHGWGFSLGLASYMSLVVQKSILQGMEVENRWVLSAGQGELNQCPEIPSSSLL